MIGRPRAATGLAAAAALGVALLFSARAPSPSEADPPRAARLASAITTAAAEVDAALGALEEGLAEALAQARRGGALVLAGDDPPDAAFEAAAAILESAGPRIAAARAALVRLRALGASHVPPLAVPDLPLSDSDALRLGAEMRSTGVTAAAVAGLREASERVLGELERALAAASRRDPDRIDAGVAAARAGLPEVERWRANLPTLEVWISATVGLLDSLEATSAALRSGDAAAAAEAAAAYQAAAEQAGRADRGLAIALADAGAAIAAGPPASLAAAMGELASFRASVASLVLTAGREGGSDANVSQP